MRLDNGENQGFAITLFTSIQILISTFFPNKSPLYNVLYLGVTKRTTAS